MSGLTVLINRTKRCQDVFSARNKPRKQSVVYMDNDGELILEEGVEYNNGVLAIPLPMTIEEWEAIE